jgi:hypothetical protein
MHMQKNVSRLLLKAAAGRNIDGFIGLVHAWRVSYMQVDERGYDVSHVAWSAADSASCPSFWRTTA